MTRHPLDSAFAKLERAKTHTSDLDTAIRAFLKTRPYRLTSQLNDQRTEEVWSIAVDPVPSSIECLAADAIHNLRTPIDKMLAAGFRNSAIHTSNAVIRGLKFPFADHPNGLKSPLEGLEKHLTLDAIEFINKAQPYKGGAGSILWAINTLDNRDKHRALTEPIKLGFPVIEGRTVAVFSGLLLRMGSRRGKHMVTDPDAPQGARHLVAPSEADAPILRLTPGTVNDYFLEYTAPYDDMEIFTTTPGAKFYADVKPSLNIAFSDVEGFEGEPVVKALETMRKAVEIVLTDFRAKFFS